MLVRVDMLGHNRSVAQGKTICAQSEGVNVTLQQIDVPRTICQFCNNVELSVDFMLVNNVLFLTPIPEYIHYGTVSSVDNLKCHTLETQVKGILRFFCI